MSARTITVRLTERQAEECLSALGSWQMTAEDDGDMRKAQVIWRADQVIRTALRGREE